MSQGLAIDVRNPYVAGGAAVAASFAVGLQWVFPPCTESKATKPHRVRIAAAVVVGVTLITAFLFYSSHADLSVRRMTPTYTQPADAVIAIYSFAFLTISRIALVPVFAVVGRKLIPRGGRTDYEWEMRVQRFAGQLWKAIFHGAMTAFPLVFLRGQKWWPPGFGDETFLFENYPHIPVVPWLREFYLVQLGYYMHALLATLLQKGKPNLVEMTVHHMATIALVAVSYFIQNTMRFGVVVLWLHDICDVPICLSRVTVDLPSVKKLASVLYVATLALWVFFRLYVFPFRVVWVSTYSCFADGFVKFSDAHGWVPLSGMLFLLVIMHVLWFVEMMGMAKVYLTKGNLVDTTESEDTTKCE